MRKVVEFGRGVLMRPFWIKDYAWGWQQDGNNPNTGKYGLVYDTAIIPGVQGQLEPWKGYWVKANTECELILPPPSQASRTSRQVKASRGKRGWALRLQARTDSGEGDALIGVAQGGRGLTVGLPPAPPTETSPVQVRVLNNKVPLAVDVRGAGRRQVWGVEVRAPGESEVAFQWSGVYQVPLWVRLQLVDPESSVRRELRSSSTYRFTMGSSGVKRLQVVAEPRGSSGLRIVGLQAVVSRGGGVSIQYTVTEPAQVQRFGL